MQNFIRYVLLIIPFFFASFLFGQNPSDKISENQFNEKYLEHLIKIKIDSVRLKNDCKILVNDSILFLAAEHHSAYMAKANRLSHFEEEDPDYHTPQLRAEAYGAVNYYVGENVLRTNANTTITSKKGKKFDTNNYDGLANSIVDSWVNSPGHYKNIITPEYQITGISVTYTNGRVFACQKFAQVLYRYYFEEVKALFPYSNYAPEPVVASFAGIRRELIPHQYEWGLKHSKMDECLECEEIAKSKPYITLRFENGSFILKVENSEYIEKLIDHPKDGFAVEIVEYNDYICGNPEYYTKPSRRNGQLRTNGRVLRPLFQKELLKGFKKRKKKKDVKYLGYIFGADSVKFFNRFSQYRMAKYESEYFEINLGKLPRDVNGLWAHNLVYIQNNQICRFDYFTGFCGELFQDSIPIKFLPLDTNQALYTFKSAQRSLFFEIPFEQNKASYTKADIDPFIESLQNTSYHIDSVNIRAYSSVEGDSISNAQLQLKRAQSILTVLQKNQPEVIPSKIITANSWDHFYRQIIRHPKYRYMARLSKKEIETEFRKPNVMNDLETIFVEERRAEIQLYVKIEVNNQNCETFARNELERIQSVLKNPETTDNKYAIELANFEKLYTYIHRKVVAGYINEKVLASINLTEGTDSKPKILEKFLLYGYEFEEAFKANTIWINNHIAIRSALVDRAYHLTSPIFKYDNAYFNTVNLMRAYRVDQVAIQSVIDELRPLEHFYNNNPTARGEIQKLNANLNLLLLNKVFTTNPLEASSDAKLSVAQLFKFYDENNLLDTSKVLQLANVAVFYTNNDQALQIAAPYSDNGKILQLMIPLGYVNPSDPLAEPYYQFLIELSKVRSAEDWCPLFMEKCKIPFQAFDHEELRDVYCEKCGVYEPEFD